MERSTRFAAAVLGFALSAGLPAVAQEAKPAMPREPSPDASAPSASGGGSATLLSKGQTLFDDQQYEESIQTLSAALLRPNNTKAQRIEIYRLLALNYITLGRKEEADSAIRALLSVEPGYELPANESPRFRDSFAEARAKWEAEGRPGLLTEQGPKRSVVLRDAYPSQADPNEAVELHARLDDPDARVATLRLFYRSGARGDFTEARAARAGASVRATIPASAVKPPLVEYYFIAHDKDGSAIATRGDASTPLRIVVREPKKSWALPVAIGGGILGAAAALGVLALAGVFDGTESAPPRGVVLVGVSEASR